jgi:O-antigen biosynthesis protein
MSAGSSKRATNSVRPERGRLGILVLGMHRSGTSAVTRTLNLLGAALPSNLLAPRSDNPAGFWESADLLQIHERFLAAVGSAWDDPLPIPAFAFQTAAAATCHDEALAVLHRDLADASIFAVKDPRICRILPLWQRILASFSARPAAVLLVRNPLEISISLRVRNGIPREHALAQWVVHSTLAAQGTFGWRRCVVDYGAFVGAPIEQSRRLSRCLGCFDDHQVDAAIPQIESFWSEELRHHRYSALRSDDASLPLWVRQVYAWFAKAAADEGMDSAPMEALVRWLTEASELYGPLVTIPGELGQAADDQAAEFAALRATLREAVAARDAKEADVVQLKGERQTLERVAGQYQSQARELSTRLETQSESLTKMQIERERLAADNARLALAVNRSNEQNAALSIRIRQLVGDLGESHKERGKLVRNLAAANKELHSAGAERTRLERALSDACHNLGLARDEQAFLRENLTDQQRRLERAVAALAAIVTEPYGEISLETRLGGLVRAALRGRFRQRRREDAEIGTIAQAGTFDAAYYFRRYPDVGAAQVDPIVHYVRCGAAEGRDPNPAFDSRFYWSAYPDVARSGANPFAHYIRVGALEGRRPHPAWQGTETHQRGLSPLLAARLAGADQNAPARSHPGASQGFALGLPADAFTWLDSEDRIMLSSLLERYGLANRGAAPRDWDAEAAARQVAAAFAKIPQRPATLSIVVPVHNQLRHTLACLESLVLWPSRHAMEVLIGDDASSDGSERHLPSIPNLKVVPSSHAEGFVDNCNRTAAAASGRYLLFLNNDTVVLPGTLDALLATFEDNPDCGLAGCRLLYPDGRLQEAGGIVWADASGWNCGRGDRPEKSEYSYLRDADYCSGAAIALPTAVWRSLGGFDVRYRPAYYEDTDLAFRVRAAGMRVLYQPEAQVIHCEGVSNGLSEEAGLKRQQRKNRPTFLARWQTALSVHGMPEAKPANFAERTRRGRVLVLDTTPPTPDRDSGSQDTAILLKLLRKQGWHVIFLPENLIDHAPYTAALRRQGIECIHYPLVGDFMAAAARIAANCDAIVVSRQPLARRVVSMLKAAAPKAKLVFNTVDLHFLREEREAELFGDPDRAARAAETRKAELATVNAADATLVVSTYEAEMLAKLTPNARVCLVPVRRETPSGPFPEFDRRDGILFIGGFRHPPNQDAVRWLLAEIWPRVRAAGLLAPLYIVGADAPPFLQSDPANNVHVVGHVPELASVFAKVRLSVAPIRYGAGLKGKVIDSLLHGVPAVATPIAVEGSGLVHERHLLVAETQQDFASSVVLLHRDAARWQRISKTGREAGRAMYSADSADRILRKLWASIGFPWCNSVDEPG